MFNFVKIVQHDQRYILKKLYFLGHVLFWPMTSYSRLFAIFSNFSAKLPKKGIDKKLLKNCKMTAIDEVIRQKQGIIWKRGFWNIFLVKSRSFSKRPLLSFARFTYDSYARLFLLSISKELCCCVDNRTAIERV